jgi:two-component system, LytTR family, response regulator
MLNFSLIIPKKMLRTLIIDDEQPVRESLLELLRANCPSVKVVGQAGSVKSGVAAVFEHHPDLILLDIKMGDGTGFDLLEQIEPAECKVIFITAYNEYAIKAFKFSALDYLLKPVDSAELAEAVNRADSLVSKELKTQYETLVHNLNTDDRAKKKIILKTFDNIYLVKVADILYCESDGRYVTIFLRSGEKVLVSNSLKYYQDILSELGFYRIHKSFLINMEHIVRFEKSEGGYIILTNNQKIPVASRKREDLLELFDRITE